MEMYTGVETYTLPLVWTSSSGAGPVTVLLHWSTGPVELLNILLGCIRLLHIILIF